VTIVVGVLAPLFFGSVDLFWVAVWTILLSISASCGVTVSLGNEQSRVLLAFLALCGLYGLISFIQITPNPFAELNDPIWQRAGDIFGIDTLPRISSRAEIPPLAAGHFLLFATALVSGFYLGTSRRDGNKLIWFARYSILLYAIYGLAALVFTPNILLWADKVAYRGSLTATFVNHNTAATYIGAGAILWLCETVTAVQSVRLSTVRVFLMSRSNEVLAFKIIVRSTATLVCLFALLRTDSRGGLICSSMGLLVAVILMVANKSKLQRRYVAAFAAAAFVLTVTLLSRLGRIASQGLIDEGRLSVYGLSWQAIKERPLLGAGIGTFADLFPAFRSNDLTTWGVWDYAHSTILEIAFEMGIPVAVLIAIGAIASMTILLRAAAKSESGDRSMLAAIAGIATLSYLHSMIDFSLQIPGYSIVFGILLGCGLARALTTKTQRRSPGNHLTATELTSDLEPVLGRRPRLNPKLRRKGEGLTMRR
jgi:O-antigen ligase